MRIAAVLALAAASAGLTPGAEDPAAKPGEGWIALMKPDVWKKFDPKWIVTDAVKLNPEVKNRLLAAPNPKGDIWVNGETGRLPDLVTRDEFGDCEAHVEFLLGQRSNSGVKFHAVYEIQFIDKPNAKELTGDSMGGIYPRAELKPSYHHIDKGIPPKVDAAKPAGEWQTLDVVWKSPRFDAKGEKVANAVVVKAVLNGKVIHENQELKTPTGHNYVKKESSTGPFMLQADHGPTAFRNVRIRPLKAE
jgi:hypothetical protein